MLTLRPALCGSLSDGPSIDPLAGFELGERDGSVRVADRVGMDGGRRLQDGNCLPVAVVAEWAAISLELEVVGTHGAFPVAFAGLSGFARLCGLGLLALCDDLGSSGEDFGGVGQPLGGLRGAVAGFPQQGRVEAGAVARQQVEARSVSVRVCVAGAWEAQGEFEDAGFNRLRWLALPIRQGRQRTRLRAA